MEIIVIDEKENKIFNLSISWGIFCLIICFISATIILFIYGIVNFTRTRIDYKRLHLLTQENALVRQELGEMEKNFKELAYQLSYLVEKDTTMKYFAHLIPVESLINNQIHEKMVQDLTEKEKELEALIKIVENQYTTQQALVDYLTNKEQHQWIPSIIPVNGWFIRGYGYFHDPFTGLIRMHEGIDIAAPEGTPIVATANGVVKKVQRDHNLGISIEIEHQEGWKTIYAHCQRPAVSEGQVVKRGEVIGYVGTTGKTTGPHLHYEIRINGIPVDPLDYVIINPTP
ncbi:MAG: peptidoglycan DD-metalloendopeptidase family protein [candidate division WOR-3 bacterium]